VVQLVNCHLTCHIVHCLFLYWLRLSTFIKDNDDDDDDDDDDDIKRRRSLVSMAIVNVNVKS